MKLSANIDLRTDRSDSIGMVRTEKGFDLNIIKSDVDITVRLSPKQILKIKQFLDNQITTKYVVKESEHGSN